jgi:hypothetical protein
VTVAGTNGHGAPFSGAVQQATEQSLMQKLNQHRAHSFMFHYRVFVAMMLSIAAMQTPRCGKLLKLRETGSTSPGI